MPVFVSLRMQLRTTILILVLGTACALKPIPRTNKLAQEAAADDDEDQAKWMLPKDVIPHSYKLDLMTHIENFNESDPDSFIFDGKVEIFIEVLIEVPKIVLHSSDATVISSVTILPEGSPG